MEAKLCSDGSHVGRTAPNCEFAACPSASPSASPDETADWQTYQNEEYEFEVKYPNGWEHKILTKNELGTSILAKEILGGIEIFSSQSLKLDLWNRPARLEIRIALNNKPQSVNDIISDYKKKY